MMPAWFSFSKVRASIIFYFILHLSFLLSVRARAARKRIPVDSLKLLVECAMHVMVVAGTGQAIQRNPRVIAA